MISNKPQRQAIKSEALCRRSRIQKDFLAVSNISCRRHASELRPAVTSSEAHRRATSGHRKLYPDWLPLPKLQPERLLTVSIQAHQRDRQFLDALPASFHFFVLFCGGVWLGRCATWRLPILLSAVELLHRGVLSADG